MAMVMQRISMGPIPCLCIIVNIDLNVIAQCEQDLKLEIAEKVEYKFQPLMPFKAQKKTSSYCPASGQMMFNSSIRTGTIFGY